MKEKLVSSNEIKTIQLQILDAVSEFCENKRLKYVLAYGTLIGAIRHHGYIPWDDDIDIVMPRPDYDKFLKEFNMNRNDSFRAIDTSIDVEYDLPFAKVHDTRTMIRETMYHQGKYGVYIDVFPLDGYNHSTIKKMNYYGLLLNAKKAIFSPMRTMRKNLIIGIGKFFLLPFSVKWIIKKMQQLAIACSYEDCNKITSAFSVYGDKDVFEKKIFEETEFCTFEKHSYRIPSNYDEYLKTIYGDYMKLPPIDKQVTHHSFIAWWL